MQNYDVAVKATNTSINSQGSALQENSRYLESAQAKVNKLKVAWEELALASGNTVFVDMITTITNDLRYLVNSINALISLDPSKGNLIGGFTMLAGVTGGLTTLMNGSVRNAVFEGKVGSGIESALANVTNSYRSATEKVTENRLATQNAIPINAQAATTLDKLKGAAVATGGGFKVAGTAVAGFAKTVGVAIATSLGIGVAIAGVTLAVGYLFTKFNEYRAKAAEEKQKQKEELKLYTDNAVAVDELSERYETLKNKTNKSVEETQLMYDTAKQLGSYLPNLVSHVDELGRTHLVNAVSTREYVDTLKEAAQIKAYEGYEKQTTAIKENNEALQEAISKQETLAKVSEDVKKATEKPFVQPSTPGYGAMQPSSPSTTNSYAPAAEAITEKQIKQNKANNADEQIKNEREINNLLLERNQSIRKLSSSYAKMSDSYVTLSAKEQESLDRALEQSVAVLIQKSNKEAKEIMDAAKDESAEVTSERFAKLNKETEKEVEELTDNLLDMFDVVSNLPSFDKVLFESMSGNSQGSAYRETLDAYLSGLREIEKEQQRILTQNNAQSADGLTGQALAEYQAFASMKNEVVRAGGEIIASANNEGIALSNTTVEVFEQNKSLDENRKASIEAVASMSDLEEVNSDVAGAVSEATNAIDDLGSALGYADGAFRSSMDAVDTYNDILAKNAEGYTYTVDEMVSLIDKNPDLIRAFEVQNGVVSLNTSVVEELREVQRLQFLEKLKQTQEEMLADALGAQMFARYSGDKIKSIKTVADAEKELVRVKKEAALEVARIEGAVASVDKDDPNYGREMYASDLAARMKAQIESDTRAIQESLDNIEQFGKNAEKIGAAIVTPSRDLYNANKAAAESNKNVSESEKDKQDTITRSTYLTNKYTEAIDKATLAVQKQAAFKNKYATGSKAYIKALESEIKAMDKQKKSVNDYINALSKANKSKSIIASTGVHKTTQDVIVDSKGNIVSSGATNKDYDIAYTSSSSGGFTKTGSKALSGWSGAKISSSFATTRTINGKTWKHEGIDIASKRGTPLESNVNGTVVHAGGANSALGIPSEYGKNVVIQDTSGIFHIYGHLDKISTKKGAKIGVGQPIGTVGLTGNTTGAHVHYEQRSALGKWNSNLVNPTAAAKQAMSGKRNTYSYSSGGSVSVSAPKTTSSSSYNKLSGNSAAGLLKGKEHLFNKYGEKYGVDPTLALAISMFETGNGTSSLLKNKNNAGGMYDSKNGTFFKFDSIEQGIESMIKNLQKNYISQGLTSIAAIQKKYAPNGANNDPNGLNKYWTDGVTSAYKKISGGKSQTVSTASTQAEKAKQSADSQSQAAEKQQALAEQVKEEERQREELQKIEEERQAIILQYLNSRADTYKSMYERYGKDEELIQSNMQTTVEFTRQSLALYEKLENNARLQRRAVELEILQMEKDKKGAWYKQLSFARQAEFNARLEDLRHLLKQEMLQEREAAMATMREKTEIRNKLYENQMRELKKNQDFLQRQMAIMDGDSNDDLIKKYAMTVEQEKTERKLWDIKKRQLDAERAVLSEVRKKYGASSKEYEQQLEFVKKYSEELLSLEDSINNFNASQKEMLQGFSENMIDTIRDALEAQRDAEIKSIEKIQKEREKAIERERNVRRNAHEKTMKEIDDERKKMNDFFDERLKQLDEQNDERTHQKQLDEFSKREQEIRSSLNRISMDDSFEAKAKRKELMKELEALQEEREEYLYQRDFEKQKEAIEKEKELYEKNLDDKQEAEEEAYEKFEEDLDRREEAESALFDKMLEDLNKYYDDILNDERKWNAIREEAMKGNFDEVKRMANEMLTDTSKGFREMTENLSKTYGDVLKDLSYLYDDTEYETVQLSDSISKAMEDIANTSKNSFESLGSVLQTNYIDKLKEALDLLSKLTGQDFDTDYKNPSKGDDLSQEEPLTGLSMYAAQTGSAKPISVRADANDTSKVIGSLVDGKGYQVLEQTGTHSKIQLSNGQTGWVSNSELSTSKQSNSWGVAISHTRAEELNKVSSPINELLKQYSTTANAHKGRLESIGYESGQRVYDDMVKESTQRIQDKQQAALTKYQKAYESATTNADRNKALDEYIKSLADMQSEIIRAKREFDALYESLQGKTSIDKNAKTSSNAALYANPYASVEGILTSIPKGTTIKILKDRGLMYEVQYGDKTGYVNKSYVGSFATGGMYTGDFEGAMPALLHKKELVLNQEQTRNMLKTVEFTDKLISPLRSLINKMQSVKSSNAPTVHIENITNDFSNNEIKNGKEASDEFMKRTMNLINNKYGKR